MSAEWDECWRMGDLSVELESVLFAAVLDDIDRGWLQRYPLDDARFAEATNLIARYPEHPLRTLDALYFTIELWLMSPWVWVCRLCGFESALPPAA